MRLLSLTLLIVLMEVTCPVFAEQQPPMTDDRSPITDNGDTIVITAEEIRDMQAHKMADVLNHVPGVTASDTSVGIHGVYKVKVFVDGRPINDPTSSHGTIKWDLVSPHEVERIEILRGKGGLRYGQDASGGVILITTKRIQRLTGNVKAYGGNYGTGYGYTNLQTTAGHWSAGVTGGFEATDGYKSNGDRERWQGGGRLTYSRNEGRSVSLTADYLEDERGLAGLPEYPTPLSRKSSDNLGLSLTANWDPMASTTFFNEGRTHNTDPSRNIDQIFRVSELGEDLSTTRDLGDWGNVNFGAAFRLGRAGGSNFDDQRETTWSLFASDSLQWFDQRLTLTAGLRANVNSDFDDAVNPELKLAYKRKKWRVTAAYGRTNNTPSFRQRYNQTSSTLPNPDLTMETADNYSLALFVKPKEKISTSVTFFYNRLSDRITYLTGDEGIGQYQNFGLVTYAGGDLSLDWQIRDRLKLKGNYTYLEAIDEETDLTLPAKAKHKARLDLFWQPAGPFSIVATGKYVSEVFRNKANTKTVPEYAIASLKAEYALKRWTVFTEMENLFDKTYYYSDGLLAPPFTWIVGVNWRM